ncbi:MAG TPA: ABC transporter ATP-binding protein [Chitinophagaceae bacterium]|nr:ABC transporter ATP-binding protein [Chitinophagaceae bacterium]
MKDTVISVENISKQYRLGAIGTGSLRQDLQVFWKKNILRQDPAFFKEVHAADHIWALDHVSFDVKQGEAVGIIGANGSGKSTLLKIISRIVQPTSGTVRGRGKISSILEVGTGFHYELSGRENIYMSGYTLGMQKQEIQKKFDEIVAFSGIEKFLDTPVKRYSSGMYVRLAFAVAAHLEPDILIVDEVLAVGDADFQKKCMGKMQSSSATDGRTILFVSHNLQAVENLCNRAIWLNKGKIADMGHTGAVVRSYLASTKTDLTGSHWEDPQTAPGNEFVRMKRITARAAGNEPFITVKTPVIIEAEMYCFVHDGDLNVNIELLSPSGESIFNIGCHSIKAEKAILALQVTIPADLLNNTSYGISLTVVKNYSQVLHEFYNCLSFEVEDVREGMYYYGVWPGLIRPAIDALFYVKDSF